MSFAFRNKMVFLLGLIIACAFLGLLLMQPGPARAEMANNLSNDGCNTCHLNYPGIKTGTTTYTMKHKFNNCQTCHSTYVAQRMWNCRYCHLTTYQGWSGFRSTTGPLYGYALGTGEVMDDHRSRPFDAGYSYHNSTQLGKHTSVFPGTDCASCHKSTLTAEHEGKTKITNDPVEDFEDSVFVLNFIGNWSLSSKTPHSGLSSYKSATIGNSTSSATETTVTVNTTGTLTFWYRVNSEAGYDKLYFYLDGVEKLGGKSGAIGWTKVSYALAAGSHTLKWAYSKDGSVASGEDSAYIDDMTITGASTSYTMDCNTCHLSSDTAVKSAITNHNTNCSACHPTTDHQALHATTLASDCQNCHAANINTEHQNRTDTAGNPYTCATCHSSTNPLVQNAIASHNKNCSACHLQADHEAVHLSGLNSSCQTCHKSVISQEHLSNSTTEGNNYTCDTCHAGAGKAVQRTMAAGRLDCTGCHSEGHNANLADTVPPDIPLYAGFAWSAPMEASLFSGDPATLSGYLEGQVAWSDRRADIAAGQVWEFYSGQLAALGWNLQSEPPAAGAQFFTATFTKESRSITVKCYNSANSDGTGELLDAGNRIEIWYK